MTKQVRSSRRGWLFGALVAAVTATLVAGCSSSSGSGSESAGNTNTGSASGSAAPSSGGAKAPIPVLVEGTWSGVAGAALPQVRDSVLAGIKDINAAGGINGAQIDPVVCDDQGDANRATQCLQQALPKHIVAWLWPSATTNTGVMPIMEHAGLVGIGGTASDEAGSTSPASFPITGAVPGIFTGMPEVLAKQAGARKISFIYPSDLGAASANLLNHFKQGVAIAKAQVAHIVGIPIATTDFGPSVATALQGADAVAVYMPEVSQQILVKTIRASDPNFPIALGSFQLGAAQVKQLGSPDHLYMVGFGAQPTADVPAAKQFTADMAKYYPKDTGLDDQSLGAWVSTQIFANIAKNLPQVTGSAVTSAMKSLKGLSLGGYAPPLTTTSGTCSNCGGATRLLNPFVAFLRPQADGTLAFAKPNQFYNAFSGASVTVSP